MMDVNQEQETQNEVNGKVDQEQVKEQVEEAVKQETAEKVTQNPADETAGETDAPNDSTTQGEDDSVKKTETEVDPRDVEIADLKDQLLRARAEFANYKRRTTEDMIRLGTFTTSEVVKKFLKVLDNFERAEKCLGEATAGPVAEGIQKIRKQFDETLKGLEVEEIKALNEKFDPNLHEAVMRGENPELEEDTIDQVYEKGYKIREQVIRHSKVRVISK